MAAQEILDAYGKIGVEVLRQQVSTISATGKTANSIRYEVTEDRLQIFGRKFFETIETGRGPRKSSEYGGFNDSMYEYMVAKGIGADLPEKKRRQLAKFLAYRINRDGDKTYQHGGRQVYSEALAKLVEELKKALIADFKKSFITLLKSQFKVNGSIGS